MRKGGIEGAGKRDEKKKERGVRRMREGRGGKDRGWVEPRGWGRERRRGRKEGDSVGTREERWEMGREGEVGLEREGEIKK